MSSVSSQSSEAAAAARAARNAAGTSSAAKSRAVLNKNMNQFLNLLTTQLKNQDPTAPMDSNRFVDQLTRFSSVEQQIRTNANLEAMLALQKTDRQIRALDYVGTTIEAAGDTNMLRDGSARWTYKVTGEPVKGKIQVFDAKGRKVHETGMKGAPGTYDFTWDGTNGKTGRDKITYPDGAYTIRHTARDSAGRKADIAFGIRARVDGIDFTGDKVLLRVGDVQVDLNTLTGVERPLTVRKTDRKTP